MKVSVTPDDIRWIPGRDFPWVYEGIAVHLSMESVGERTEDRVRSYSGFLQDVVNYIKDIGGQGYFVVLREEDEDAKDFYRAIFKIEDAVEAGWSERLHRMVA